MQLTSTTFTDYFEMNDFPHMRRFLKGDTEAIRLEWPDRFDSNGPTGSTRMARPVRLEWPGRSDSNGLTGPTYGPCAVVGYQDFYSNLFVLFEEDLHTNPLFFIN